MQYCEICKTLNPGCCFVEDHPLREPQANDPVLLVRTDPLHADMLEPLLQDADIPYSRQGRLGVGMTLRAGNLLEEYTFYVPYSAYEQAQELSMVIAPRCSD